MADVFKINSSNPIYNTLGLVLLPNTGVDVFNQKGLINITDIENKYSGEFLPASGSSGSSTVQDTDKVVQLNVTSARTFVVTGNNQAQFVVPPSLSGYVLTSAHAYVTTTGTGNTTDIMLTRTRSGSSVNMLTSGLRIDTGENGTDTASNAYVINTSNDDVASYDVIGVNVTGSHTVPARGLIVTMVLEI